MGRSIKILFIFLSSFFFIEAHAIQKTTILLDAIVRDINNKRENRKTKIRDFQKLVTKRAQNVEEKELEIVRILRSEKHFLYVNTEIEGTHILIYCIKNKMWLVVKELIEAGSNLDYKDSLGKVPLMYAAESKNRDIVNLLLINRADKTATDSEGVSTQEYLRKNGFTL